MPKCPLASQYYVIRPYVFYDLYIFLIIVSVDFADCSAHQWFRLGKEFMDPEMRRVYLG